MATALLTVLLFCRALSANDIRAFMPLIGGKHNPPTRLMRRLRNVTENFDCVTVSSYRWTLQDGEIVIDVDAEGITRNAKHERRAIPSRWYLTRSAGLKAGRPAGVEAPANIIAFDDETSRLESHLIDARNDAERDALVAQYSRDVVIAAARLLSEDVPLGDAPAMRAATEFLVNWSRDTENRELESYALSALANIDKTLKPRLLDAARDAARQSQSCDAIAYADFQASTTLPKAQRLDLLKSIADSADSLDNPRPAILALRDMIGTYSTDYALSDAYASIDRLNAVAHRYGNAEGIARALFFRARAAVTVFDAGTSLPLFLQTRALADDYQMSRLSGLSSFGLYMSYDLAGQQLKAVESLRDALRVLQREDSDLIALAHGYLSSYLLEHFHQVREAEAHYEAAIAMPEIGGYRQNVLGTGAYLRYETGRYDEAIQLAREAIALDPDGLDWVWTLRNLAGRILVECGHAGEGIEELRTSIDFVEARRALSTTSAVVRAGYTHHRSAPYRDLVDALIAEKRFDEALAVAEHLRARSLSEALPRGAQDLPLTESERQQEREMNQRIVDLNRTLVAAAGDREAEGRRQLRTARADLERFTVETFMRHSTHAWTVHDDTSELASQWRGAPIVEYLLLREDVAVFVVRDGKVSGRILTASGKELEARAKRFVDRIQNRDIDYGDDAHALYDALIAPIADLLPQHGMLYVVPDAFLWRVPFDALMTPAHHFLAERYAIAYAPSVLTLSHSTHRPSPLPQRYELLAIGDPLIASATSRKAAEYRSLTLGLIPDARLETRALGKLYGARRSTVLTGASARETLLKKVVGNYRIVHLATHGIVDDASPLYSAIVLASAKGDPDDGLLEMREMSNLNLHADLVVLSGCDTARGDVLTGEGVIGMSWALFSAGCPTTVVSQWKAMSHSTAELMIAFHKHLHAGEPKAIALRHARLQLMKTPAYHHPFYWAPFVMVGEGEGGVR